MVFIYQIILQKLKKIFQDLKVKNLSKLYDEIEILGASESFIVVINDVNERVDKNGKKFCFFFTLADDSAQIDAICFSEVTFGKFKF